MKQKQYASKWKTERRTHHIAPPGPPRETSVTSESRERLMKTDDDRGEDLKGVWGEKRHKIPQKTC